MINEMIPNHLSRRVRIEGRVQGVWFRDWTVETARKLGLTGWVRNRLDGSVEAVACGTPAQIDAFIERCRSGPDRARVNVVHVEAANTPEEDAFVRRPDA